MAPPRPREMPNDVSTVLPSRTPAGPAMTCVDTERYSSSVSETVSTPVSRVFRSESEMRRPVDRWLVSQGFLTKSEFTLPWGICDIVAVQFREESAKQRVAYRQTRPVRSLELIQLLELMPRRRAITVAKLRGALAPLRSSSQLDANLQRLKEMRLVSSPRRNQIRKLAPWAPLQRRIVAVEMKLSRVSAALAQAKPHLAFADECYVALPNDVAVRVSEGYRKKDFLDRGVGLLGVTPHDVHVLLRPGPCATEATLSSLLQAYCTERFWTMWLTSNTASAV